MAIDYRGSSFPTPQLTDAGGGAAEAYNSPTVASYNPLSDAVGLNSSPLTESIPQRQQGFLQSSGGNFLAMNEPPETTPGAPSPSPVPLRGTVFSPLLILGIIFGGALLLPRLIRR